MARYTGPKSKVSRKFGEPIFGPDKAFEKRNYPLVIMEITGEEQRSLNMQFNY